MVEEFSVLENLAMAVDEILKQEDNELINIATVSGGMYTFKNLKDLSGKEK